MQIRFRLKGGRDVVNKHSEYSCTFDGNKILIMVWRVKGMQRSQRLLNNTWSSVYLTSLSCTNVLYVQYQN